MRAQSAWGGSAYRSVIAWLEVLKLIYFLLGVGGWSMFLLTHNETSAVISCNGASLCPIAFNTGRGSVSMTCSFSNCGIYWVQFATAWEVPALSSKPTGINEWFMFNKSTRFISAGQFSGKLKCTSNVYSTNSCRGTPGSDLRVYLCVNIMSRCMYSTCCVNLKLRQWKKLYTEQTLSLLYRFIYDVVQVVNCCYIGGVLLLEWQRRTEAHACMHAATSDILPVIPLCL